MLVFGTTCIYTYLEEDANERKCKQLVNKIDYLQRRVSMCFEHLHANTPYLTVWCYVPSAIRIIDAEPS